MNEKDELIRTMLSMLQDLSNNYGWDQLASTLEDVEQAAQELGANPPEHRNPAAMTWREGEVMSAIPQGVTHLEVTGNGANFWSITEPDDGTGEVWLGGRWMASEISDRLMQRLISFTPLQRPEPWGPNDIIPLGEGSITGEAYRRGLTATRGYLPPRMTEQREIQELLGRFGVYGQVPTGVATQIYNAALDEVSEINSKLGELPIKVVADVSGGALHGVYAELPVEVLFISDDADDISSQQEELSDDEMRRDTDGNLIASWAQASEGGGDAEMVHHYFEQKASDRAHRDGRPDRGFDPG